LYIKSLKLQQISLITKLIDTYNSSNSRYISYSCFRYLLHSSQISTAFILDIYQLRLRYHNKSEHL